MKCARHGCERAVPELAQKHGDRHCSTRCAKIAYGTVNMFNSAKEQASKAPKRRQMPMIISLRRVAA